MPIEIGNWVVIPEQHFHFHLKFVFDRLSVPFVILSFVLCGTIGAFTSRYLHREPGYGRFFVFFALFLLGMIVSSLAGTIETLFFGWELVGTCRRRCWSPTSTSGPTRCEMASESGRCIDSPTRHFLIAALAMHHLTGAGDFEGLMGTGPWPEGQATISQSHALFVGLLLLVAAAGKSALVPFSGWLPRAMEGPTPSSAIFYGALSVHLGAFLLLRVSPILEQSLLLSGAVVAIGLASADLWSRCRSRANRHQERACLCLADAGRASSSPRSAWDCDTSRLIHIIGHACLANAAAVASTDVAARLSHAWRTRSVRTCRTPKRSGSVTVPQSIRAWVYRFALERGFLDAILNDYIVRPFVARFASVIRWSDDGPICCPAAKSRESDEVKPHTTSLEEFV